MNPIVKVNKIYPDARIPTYGTEKAACADVYAYIPADQADLYDEQGNPIIFIHPHKTRMIGTGLRFAPADGWAILGYARSGLASKKGLAPANKVGVIDCDYRGEAMVPLHNHSDTTQEIVHGDRIAQFMFVPYYQAQFDVVDELDETKRGDKGFGSTGV
jgi:dUTP pyrophosphatase